MAAILQFEQATAPAGPGPGLAFYTGTVINQLVTVTSEGVASTHEARILYQPEEDSATLTQTNVTTWTFTPNPTGGLLAGGAAYRIELVTDRGLPTEDRTIKVFGIRDSNGVFLPPANARADPEANVPDLSDATLFQRFLRASEMNEPDADYPNGNPFGWHTEVRAALRAAAGGGASSNPFVGEQLFAWNRTDTTQFESTAQPFENSLGGGTRNAGTAMVLTVADLGNRFGNGLIFTCTSLQGGGFFPVLTSELTLPDEYVIYCEWFSGDAPFAFGVVPYADIDTPTDVQGYILTAQGGLSGMNFRAIVNDQNGNAEVWTTGQSLLAGTALRGGLKVQFEVKRQRAADNPAESFAAGEIRIPGSTGNANAINWESALPAAIAGVSPNHDGLDMDRIGVGGSEGVNGSSGVFRIRRFEVYALPET